MTAMKAQKLWPIWPAGEQVTPRSLGEQLASFSVLQIPTINADRDAPYEPGVAPISRSRSRVLSASVLSEQNLHGGWAAVGSSPIPSARACDAPDPQVPTLRTVLGLWLQLEKLCVGLCLDCLKGNEVCRLPHPDPWVEYRERFGLWLDPASMDDAQEMNNGWENYDGSEGSIIGW